MGVINNKGFAVLTSVLLLSIAGIVFTTNMAFSQLIDNQIIANYYRNNEAFVNAESGIHLILSQIDQSTSILNNLPISFHPSGSYFTVEVERINKNTVAISSFATSKDGTAHREIHLQINHEVTYNLPLAAISSNGLLNLDATATINDGCEGVNALNCKSPGNIAQYQLLSNLNNEVQETVLCGDALLEENRVDQKVFYNEEMQNNFMIIGEKINVIDEYGNNVFETITWPNNLETGADFYGLVVDQYLSPDSLLESTFGVAHEDAIYALENASDVLRIDMNDSDTSSCSTRLAELDESVSTIYIKGDCDIEDSSSNSRFTIGSVDNPKLVFIEGGTFINSSLTGTSVVGMLHFLPELSDEINVEAPPELVSERLNQVQQPENQDIDVSGIRVNGALLSEYDCLHNNNDKAPSNGSAQHLSVRYDKTVLNKLYENLGRIGIDSGYRIVAGSWRDF